MGVEGSERERARDTKRRSRDKAGIKGGRAGKRRVEKRRCNNKKKRREENR